MDAPAMFTRKHVPENIAAEEEGGQQQLHRDEKPHKPVLKKVKDKVKKIKNTIAGKGHGNGNEHENDTGGSNSSDMDEEDAAMREAEVEKGGYQVEKGGYQEDVEDKRVMDSSPELHGAPMYESDKIPAALKEVDHNDATGDRLGHFGGPAAAAVSPPPLLQPHLAAAMATNTRPLVSVKALEGDMANDSAALALAEVFRAPIRPDIVRFAHRLLSCNKRQPYAVSPKAGHQTSAESWGTGRAVSRIPRVPGGGTHRAGQGAFGNMCRGGRMFAPTKVWRKWHRRVNVQLRRVAVISALAATAVPALVLARGHRIETVPEMPLVISDSAESIEKTSQAIKILKQIGAYADAEKAKDSVGIRAGKGKMRNRRYINRKGPLIVYGTEGSKIVKAFRNLPGVDVANVERLNLLDLAPGGHLGRFVIWTESAFKKLEEVYGTFDVPSLKKKGFVLPRSKMSNADLGRIINSDEVQSVVKPINKEIKLREKRRNPLKNAAAVLKLNPYFGTARRMATLAEAARVKARKEKIASKRTKLSPEEAAKIKAAGKAWYKTMISDSDYTEFDVFSKWLGVSQ